MATVKCGRMSGDGEEDVRNGEMSEGKNFFLHFLFKNNETKIKKKNFQKKFLKLIGVAVLWQKYTGI